MPLLISLIVAVKNLSLNSKGCGNDGRRGNVFPVRRELMVPYVAATSCATATAVGLNILTKVNYTNDEYLHIVTYISLFLY